MTDLIEVPPKPRSFMAFLAHAYRRIIEGVRYDEEGATDEEVLAILKNATAYLEDSIAARKKVASSLKCPAQRGDGLMCGLPLNHQGTHRFFDPDIERVQ
jgi:hypothetical protein